MPTHRKPRTLTTEVRAVLPRTGRIGGPRHLVDPPPITEPIRPYTRRGGAWSL